MSLVQSDAHQKLAKKNMQSNSRKDLIQTMVIQQDDAGEYQKVHWTGYCQNYNARFENCAPARHTIQRVDEQSLHTRYKQQLPLLTLSAQ